MLDLPPAADEAVLVDGAPCSVCGDSIDGPLQCCPRCETPHHPECWEYNEGCAVYGCKAALLVVRDRAAATLAEGALELPTPEEAPPPLLWQLSRLPPVTWRLVGGGLLFAVMGMLSLTAARPGFFGGLSILILLLAVAALSLVLSADALPLLLRDLGGPPPRLELEETPLKRLEAQLSEDPKNPHLLEMVAFGCYASGRFADALECYQDLLHLRPHEQRAAYQRAKCLERLGRVAAAREAFEALAAAPRNETMREQARFWLGVLDKRARRSPPEPRGTLEVP